MSKLIRGRFGRPLILILTGAMLLGTSASALEVTIGWDAPTENEDGTPLTDLAGYRVYHGTESGLYTQVSPTVTEEQYTITGLDTEQSYNFAVTALDTSGNESDFSEELERLAKAITPVIFSDPGGLLDSLLVSISSGTEAASIHVTLDGSTPTAASPVYSDPILLPTTTTLKAIAVKDGMRDSHIAEETFSINAPDPAPTVMIVSPSDGEGYAEGDTLLIIAQATAPTGSITRVDFYANGEKVWEDSKRPYVYTWVNAKAGTVVLQAKATDDAGNVGESPTRIFTVLGAVDVDVFGQDAGANGLVAIEAENYHAYTSGNRSGWSLVSDASASGEFAFKSSLAGHEPEDATFESTRARLDYQVEFKRSGTHYVWLRGASNNGKLGSVYIGLNGAGAEPDARVAGIDGRTLVWTDETESGLAAAVHIPSPGVHTLHLWVREGNVTVDKVILTPSADFVPEGFGPQESYQNPTEVAATQTAPTEPTPPSLTLVAQDPSGDWMTLSFLRNLMDTETEYAVESSTDMINWVPYPGTVNTIATATSSSQVETCILELDAPASIQSQGQGLYVRVRVLSSEL